MSPQRAACPVASPWIVAPGGRWCGVLSPQRALPRGDLWIVVRGGRGCGGLSPQRAASPVASPWIVAPGVATSACCHATLETKWALLLAACYMSHNVRKTTLTNRCSDSRPCSKTAVTPPPRRWCVWLCHLAGNDMFLPRMKVLFYRCKCIHFTRSKICYAFKWPCGLTVKALARGLRACRQRWEVRIPPRLFFLFLIFLIFESRQSARSRQQAASI